MRGMNFQNFKPRRERAARRIRECAHQNFDLRLGQSAGRAVSVIKRNRARRNTLPTAVVERNDLSTLRRNAATRLSPQMCDLNPSHASLRFKERSDAPEHI